MEDFIEAPEPMEAPPPVAKGRPHKYATPEDAKAAKREQDRVRKRRERREAKGKGKAKPSGMDEVDELRKAYADLPELPEEADPVPGQGAPEPAPAPMGHILLAITDTVAPFVIAKAMRRDASRLGLTAGEKERLAPLADAAAEKMLAKTDPVKLFILTVSSIYFAKAQALPKLPKQAKGHA